MHNMALIQTIQVPLLAVNDTYLTIIEIKGETGRFVKKGDVLMIFETSKTTYDVEAETDGYIEFLCEAGVDYEVNTVVARIYEDKAEIPLSSLSARPVADISSDKDAEPGSAKDNGIFLNWAEKPLFSKRALDQIKTKGLKESDFNGKVFVSASDVLEFVAQPLLSSFSKHSVNKQPVKNKSSVIPIDTEKVELIPLSKNKRTEIEFLSSVQSSGLTSTISVFIETKGLFTHLNKSLHYFKDSILPVLVYEIARLLKDYKALNAYYTESGIAFYNSINIGFAADMDKGLKVLKIKDADTKSISEIESDVFSLSEKYVDDRILLEDLTEINFTITDLSAEGVASFVPLINFMNSGILGVSAIDTKLERLNLSLTFDHRVTEGKLAALFLSELKQRIESYAAQDNNESIKNIHCFNCGRTLGEDLSGIGFVKAINQQGKENYVCQSCFKGF